MTKSARDTQMRNELRQLRRSIEDEIQECCCERLNPDTARIDLDTLQGWAESITDMLDVIAEGDATTIDPKVLATEMVHRFELYRDLYAILDIDEHCHGGVRMVGQIQILRDTGTVFSSVEAAIWMELESENPPVDIKDYVKITAKDVSQNRCVKHLLDEHMKEFLDTNRWSGNHPDDYDLSEESGWIHWLESGGLVVIKQTL